MSAPDDRRSGAAPGPDRSGDEPTQIIPDRREPGPGPQRGPAEPAEQTAVLSSPAGTSVQPQQWRPPRPARSPRSRSVMIAVISVLAVLTVLVVGDRIANAVAENAVATQVSGQLASAADPQVRIGGFPFVTQALSGSFSSVQLVADDVTVEADGRSIAIARLDATASDVTATNGYADVVAGRVDATAVIGWPGMSDLIGQPTSYDTDDRIRIDFNIPVIATDAYVTGRPQLDVEGQRVSLADPKVNVASVDVPEPLVQAVAALQQGFAIGPLPYGATLTDLTVQPDGVAVGASVRDVPLRGQ